MRSLQQQTTQVIHAHLEGHLIFGHIAQDNEAFLLRLPRTEAELLCRAAWRERDENTHCETGATLKRYLGGN